MGCLLLGFGGLTTFFGGKFFPYVLSTVGGGLTFLIVLLLASVMGFLKALDKNRDPTSGQVAATVVSFLVAAGLAIFVAWFLKKIRRIGLCLLGTAAGFFLGFLLYTLVLVQWLENSYVLFALCFFGATFGGYLAYRFDKHIIIYLTSFLGAYAFIRGISIFAGSFPNEVVLYGQISSGTFEGLDAAFYGYLAGIVVLGILGNVFQFKKGYHQHEDDDDNYKKL